MSPSGTRPNLLLIVVDCLRADAAAGMRDIPLPAFAALRDRGTSFEQTITTATNTPPAVASILTGLFPFDHGVRSFESPLPEGVRTVAQQLRAAGHYTAAYVTGPLLPELRLDRGFDSYECRAPSAYLDGEWGADFRRRLAEGSIPEPWFILLHLWELHLPRHVPARFDRHRYGRLLYERALCALDEQLARLIDVLPERTVVSVTGDHGEQLATGYDTTKAVVRLVPTVARTGARAYELVFHRPPPGVGAVRSRLRLDMELHGFTVNEELIRVPWIVAGPQVRSARRVRAQTRHVDIAPTLLSLAGVTGDTSGSEIDLATDAPVSERVAYTEASGGPASYLPTLVRGVRADGYKLVLTGADVRLYDIRSDPEQRHDLAPGEPARVAALRAKLDDLMSGPKLKTSSARLTADEERKVVRRLAALGYLED